MPLTAIPAGIEFRKLTQVQKRALDDYLSKEKETTLLQTVVSTLIPSITAIGIATGVSVLAWAYLKDLNPKELFFETTESAGGGLADAILGGLDKVGAAFGATQNPSTPENILLNPEASPRDYRYAGPLSRCERWEQDAMDVVTAINEGKADSYGGTILAGLALLNIAKQMKKEGCNKPLVISQAQWDQA